MFYNFNTTTCGKWILAGEHAVLRGHPALVFPVKSQHLCLVYDATHPSLSANYHGQYSHEIQLLFWSVLEHGLQLLDNSLNHIQGHFDITCNIPIGAGMGASAALCVAASRWFSAQRLIIPETELEFAQTLEHLFHGRSSGLDIMGVSTDGGVYFQQGHAEPITLAWQPHWYLSSCGQLGITAHCIEQVQQLWNQDPTCAKAIDKRMQQAVDNAYQSLTHPSETALTQLTKAIKDSASCFRDWGLINDKLHEHMESLYTFGALAVKPTGSGGGGHVLSLWKEKPTHLPFALIEP